MNKRLVFIIIILLLISIFYGCTEQKQENKESPKYVIMDSGEYRTQNNEINYAYIDIQNIDEKTIYFDIEFTFGVIDLDKLGEGYDWGGNSGDWYPEMDPYDYSYELTKQDHIQSHETKRITCYTNPQSGSNINMGWDYDISANFE